ncbi:MAG TPA: hypothetical protein VLN26_04070 [Gaiellaceae bacterium]|nr:hypothetical protein [Gaiellaceae bacterium]
MSRHYRDSAILYGVLAALVVVIAAVTGGNVALAAVLAAAAFVVAMAWTWWRSRAHGRQEPGQ